MKNIVKKTIIIIMALVCTGAVFYMFWLGGAFLPGWISWNSGTLSDSSGQYEIVLERKKAKVIYDGSVIWNSPDETKVQQVMSCDIDRDQKEELILLCWKVGRFGESRPFWVEEDEKKWSQHIFVYQYDQGEIKPKWMSSYIGQDVAWMAVYEEAAEGKSSYDGGMSIQGENGNIEDSNTENGNMEDGNTENSDIEDGNTENSNIEDSNAENSNIEDSEHEAKEHAAGRPHLLLKAPDGKTSSWIWDSWGFTREETEVSFVVFGDILTHEPIYRYGLNHDGNFDFLFENMKDDIAGSDIAVINQETPLTDDPAMYGDYPRFGTPAGVGKAVTGAGFDVVTCATNHMLDRGAEGVNFTKNFFEANEIVCLGIQYEGDQSYCPYSIVVKKDVRFAMLNYTYGTNGIRIPEDSPNMVHLLDDEEKVGRDIATARRESDFVIVFAHWGTEYEEMPDDFQRKWTRIFLENGVDVVIGTHPHTLQPYEVLRTGEENGHEMLVYYSIGNYVSAQYEESCEKGGMAEFTVSLTPEGYRVTEYTLEPLTIMRQADGRYTVDKTRFRDSAG